MILARTPDDLTAARDRIVGSQADAASLLEASLQAAESPACHHVFLRRFDTGARAQAAAVDVVHRAGGPLPALAGLAVSVKDLFDVEGQPTTGGSVVMGDAPAATADAAAVARLRRAGAALIGLTCSWAGR